MHAITQWKPRHARHHPVTLPSGIKEIMDQDPEAETRAVAEAVAVHTRLILPG